jgi:DNA mismatch repair protein MutH
MTGAELWIGLVVLAVVLAASRGAARRRRARAAAAVAELGTSPVSLLGRVLATTGVIVGVQWLVIVRYAENATLLVVVLAVPALITAATVVRLLTVTVVGSPRRRGDRR